LPEDDEVQMLKDFQEKHKDEDKSATKDDPTEKPKFGNAEDFILQLVAVPK